MRKLKRNEEVALIFSGQKSSGQTDSKKEGYRSDADKEHESNTRLSHQPTGCTDVLVGEASKDAVETFEKTGAKRLLGVL